MGASLEHEGRKAYISVFALSSPTVFFNTRVTNIMTAPISALTFNPVLFEGNGWHTKGNDQAYQHHDDIAYCLRKRGFHDGRAGRIVGRLSRHK